MIEQEIRIAPSQAVFPDEVTGCIECGDPNHEADPEPEDESTPCVLCGQPSRNGHVFCGTHQRWIEDALVAALPALRDRLEQTHGAELDAFIRRGRLDGSHWRLLNPEEAARLCAEALASGFDWGEGFDLRFLTRPWNIGATDDPRPYWQPYLEDEPDWFVEHVTASLLPAVTAALESLPTAAVEREIIDAWASVPDDDDLDEHETATEMLFSSTRGGGVSNRAVLLAELRYDPMAVRLHARAFNVPPRAWLDERDLLPPEVAAVLETLAARGYYHDDPILNTARVID